MEILARIKKEFKSTNLDIKFLEEHLPEDRIITLERMYFPFSNVQYFWDFEDLIPGKIGMNIFAEMIEEELTWPLKDVGGNNEGVFKKLSNFSAFSFEIDGIKCASMEGFLQSLKFEDIEEQEKVCLLVGFQAKKKVQ